MKTDVFTRLKQLMFFMFLLFASMTKASAVDTINSINGPTSITKGKSITLNIDYETGDKDLLFVLQEGQYPWRIYHTVRKHSNEDGRQIEFTVPDAIPANIPLMYQAILTKKGKSWNDRVSVKYQEGMVLNTAKVENSTKNEQATLDKSKWSYFGNTYGKQSRTYNGNLFIYSTPKDIGSGIYQKISTEIGREYEVTAILIGSDTNRKEQFNGESYLTISSAFPTQGKNSVFEESEHVTGAIETKVSFRFTAISSKTYLALRSDRSWHYASARAISVKVVGNDSIEDTTKPVITLNGDTSITLYQNETYVELGATANDNVDGDITANIEIGSNVDTSTVGTYKVKYNVSDTDDNEAVEVIRTVRVVAKSEHYKPLRVVNLTDTFVINQNNQIIENIHFICNNTNFEALKISAYNTLVKGNLFENCATGINLSDAFNTHIMGNRFKHVGSGIVATGMEENSVITYNEFINMGEINCDVATGGGNCNIYGPRELSKNNIFSHNLVDNRGFNARYMEDYIGIFSGSADIKQNIKVEDNTLIGSLVSSSSGACIIGDGEGSGYEIRRNKCYNVSGYGIGIASNKDARIEDNLVYMDKEHVEHITKFNSNIKSDGSYTFGATRYHGSCAKNITLRNNKSYSYIQSDYGNLNYGWQCLTNEGGNFIADNKNISKNGDGDIVFSINGNYKNNIVLQGNTFYRYDPYWKIPSNLFDGLDSNYFSGNTH